jgi:hypothetical protein
MEAGAIILVGLLTDEASVPKLLAADKELDDTRDGVKEDPAGFRLI